MPDVFGGKNDEAERLAKQEAEARQRRSLADIAQRQAEQDQSTSTGGRGRRGGQLLKFLSGSGQGTLG